MNRRNVLTGLGGLAISGGALFGTGAFTSVSATRSVEVNVFGGTGSTDGVVDGAAEEEEENIAETITGGSDASEGGGAVDVLINTADSSISVKSPDGNTDLDGTNLFPSEDSIYSDAIGTEYVSLVANDVTIAFGGTAGLPPNSSLGFSNLFAFVPNTNGNNFDVGFESSTTATESLLTKIGTNSLDSNGFKFPIDGVSLSGGHSDISSDNITDKSASVDTKNTDYDSQTLDIIIEQS